MDKRCRFDAALRDRQFPVVYKLCQAKKPCCEWDLNVNEQCILRRKGDSVSYWDPEHEESIEKGVQYDQQGCC